MVATLFEYQAWDRVAVAGWDVGKRWDGMAGRDWVVAVVCAAAFAGQLETLRLQKNVLCPQGDDCLSGRFCREFSGLRACFLHFSEVLESLTVPKQPLHTPLPPPSPAPPYRPTVSQHPIQRTKFPIPPLNEIAIWEWLWYS